MTDRSSTVAAWQVAVPTMIPLVVMLYLLAGIVSLTVPVVALVVACALLFGTAAWLNRALFGRFRPFLPFAAAIVVVLLVWVCQGQAYVALVEPSGLAYGYFLGSEGARARFWVLTCPYWIGVGSLVPCCLAALLYWWRSGARLALLLMVPWWVAALVIFSMPSAYLDWQGTLNAVSSRNSRTHSKFQILNSEF